jgi:teichuronic acid biosynthesis glycosyltransferase TuaC
VKILVFTNMYPSAEKPWGGIFVKEQADDLRALGLDMEVLSFDGTRNPMNYFKSTTGLRAALKKDDFDLVHAHYGLTGAAALSQRSVPVVTTFHGSDYNVAWQALVSWVVARRTTPIFVSSEAKRRLGLSTAPVIPAGVDTDLFVPRDRESARRELGWDVADRYVLFPGSRAAKRKSPDLFDAAAAIARRSVPALHSVNLENLDRAEVARVMNAVDVSVITSVAEGSPMVVKESLACETPVVSVPVGDVPEMLANLPGCAIVPRDAQRLADAIISALAAERDHSLRDRVSPFSRPRIAEQVAAVYESAVKRRSR